MGSITLSEVAYAPFGLVAALNDVQTVANLTWQAPDPTAVDITESFESGIFPPVGWVHNSVIQALPILPECILPGALSEPFPTICPGSANQWRIANGLWWDYNHQDEWLITTRLQLSSRRHP
jgi:hypothetical protein